MSSLGAYIFSDRRKRFGNDPQNEIGGKQSRDSWSWMYSDQCYTMCHGASNIGGGGKREFYGEGWVSAGIGYMDSGHNFRANAFFFSSRLSNKTWRMFHQCHIKRGWQVSLCLTLPPLFLFPLFIACTYTFLISYFFAYFLSRVFRISAARARNEL